MITTNEIRKIFLDYFKKHGHEVVKSAPLLPHNDPTLLFTNAGMVPFKNVFTGVEKRNYTRATSSQKCLRAGGKHNDLENVGYTARHHTFFEMLGNFSFGDYFKKDAISFAWDLLTNGYKLSPEKLLVTVYHTDDEAYDIWRNVIGLPADKVIKISTNDNFWSMGDTGPCGPCSEIFYDHGEEVAGGPPGSPEEDGDRFVEIWNLVFMQYNQLDDGSREDLPAPSIDTGMGLERIATILQGKHDNYDIDLFQNLIKDIVEKSGVPYQGDARFSHRVIADHLRACGFMIADGITPSNEGRGYVLRRIMRRAMRHAHILGCKDSLMYRLVPSLVREMGDAFPELQRAQNLIEETLRLEEDRFKQTLDNGLRLLEKEKDGLLSSGSKELSGEVAFKLYDTYGFPVDLTQDILKKDGIVVNMDEFNQAMEKQKQLARQSWTGNSGEGIEDKVWHDIYEKHGATEFTGYDSTESRGTLLDIVKIVSSSSDNNNNDNGNNSECFLIFDQTPFYAESGGQVGDTGAIYLDGKVVAKVLDTKKFVGSIFAHRVSLVDSDAISKGSVYDLVVDADRREAIRANHSATHLLHAALRQVLGESVNQKGSYVGPDRLRFDFSYAKAVEKEKLLEVERLVNRKIRENHKVITKIMDADDAIQSGAMALFGEKYGDKVRVLLIGDDNFSVELCGGTHVNRTGDIGFIKIISESSVASGIRRIEALTGLRAEEFITDVLDDRNNISALLKTTPTKLRKRVEKLLLEKKDLEKSLAKAKNSSSNVNEEKVSVNGVDINIINVKDVEAKQLKPMADQAKQKIGSGIVIIVGSSAEGAKVSTVVGVTTDLTDRYNAVDIVRVVSETLGGKGGGGRPDLAQAGGNNIDGIKNISQRVIEFIS